MNDENSAEQAFSETLIDDDLAQVVGGTEGPGGIGDDNGAR